MSLFLSVLLLVAGGVLLRFGGKSVVVVFVVVVVVRLAPPNTQATHAPHFFFHITVTNHDEKKLADNKYEVLINSDIRND
jgi:hypothetical protein